MPLLKEAFKILDFSSNDMTQPRLLVKEFDRIIDSFNPDIVYGHWNHDSHQDHVSVANSVIASTRKNRCSVYMYEIYTGFCLTSLLLQNPPLDLIVFACTTAS